MEKFNKPQVVPEFDAEFWYSILHISLVFWIPCIIIMVSLNSAADSFRVNVLLASAAKLCPNQSATLAPPNVYRWLVNLNSRDPTLFERPTWYGLA